MKKLVALLFIIILLCSTAIAEEITGISINQFEKYMNISLEKYSFSSKPKIVFEQQSVEDQPAYQTTLDNPSTVLICFKSTNLIELAYSCISKATLGSLAWAEYTLAFLSGGIQVSDSAQRYNTALLLFASSANISEENITPSGAAWLEDKQDNYYLYTLFNTDGSLVLAYVHEASSYKYEYLYPLFCGLLGINETGFANAHIESINTSTVEGTTTLSIGEWECPDHIPAGEYIVTPIKSAGIEVYRNGELKVCEYLSTDDNDEIGRLVLISGDTLEIQYGKLQFTPFE